MLSFPGIAKYHNHPIGVVDITVAFHDVDAMNVVWHGNYIKYFEIARCATLREIDYDYAQMKSSGYMWPIVEMRTRHILPAEYGDLLQVFGVIDEWDLRLSIKYFTLNKNTNKIIARGGSTQVPVSAKTKRMDMCGMELIGEKVNHWRAQNVTA